MHAVDQYYYDIMSTTATAFCTSACVAAWLISQVGRRSIRAVDLAGCLFGDVMKEGWTMNFCLSNADTELGIAD